MGKVRQIHAKSRQVRTTIEKKIADHRKLGCFVYGTKKHCGNCSRCLIIKKVLAVKKKEEITAKCAGRWQQHLPEGILKLMEEDEALFLKGYDGHAGFVDVVMDGPTVVECELCDGAFAFYKVLWEDCEDDFGWGPGVTLCAEENIPEQDLENYYKAKISQAKQEFLALQEKKQQIEEELEAAGKIMDDPVKAMTYAFEAQHLDMEMELGAEAAPEVKRKTRRGKRKTRRGGDKFRDFLSNASSNEMFETISSSTINSTKFAAEHHRFKQRWNQYNAYRERKQQKQQLQPQVQEDLIVDGIVQGNVLEMGMDVQLSSCSTQLINKVHNFVSNVAACSSSSAPTIGSGPAESASNWIGTEHSGMIPLIEMDP